MKFISSLIIAVAFIIVALLFIFALNYPIDRHQRPLTVDLTRQAEIEIAKTFQNTDKNFAVWPSNYTIWPGFGLFIGVGIRNNDARERILYYVVNMKALSTDTNINTEEVSKWVLVPGSATKIDPTASATRQITLNIPNDAPQGKYLFDVYTCYGVDASEAGNPSNCAINSDNIWGSPQPVTISVNTSALYDPRVPSI